MSEEQLKAFLEAVKADVILQEKIRVADALEEVVALAQAAGFEISVEELKAAQVDLSDEDLESVAGGRWALNIPGWCDNQTLGVGGNAGAGGTGGNGGAGGRG